MAMQNRHYYDMATFFQVIEDHNDIHMTVDERVLLFLVLVHVEIAHAEIIEQMLQGK